MRPQLFYRYGALLIGLVPVLVYCLSCALFEINSETTLKIKQLVLENLHKAPIKPELMVAEYKARLLWQCSSLLSIGAYVLVIIWSCSLIYRCCQSGANIIKIVFMGSVIVTLTLLQITHAGPDSAVYNAIFNTTYAAVSASSLLDQGIKDKVYWIISTINLMAVLTPVLILVTVCGTLSYEENDEPDLNFFIDRIGYLKQGITAGSIILLFGIIHMVAWLQWPQALMTDSAFAKTFIEYVHGNSQFWGISFTLLLLSLYVTATAALKSRALEVLDSHAGPENKDAWLAENGFTLSLQKHALQLGMMLMPSMAGSFNTLF